MILPEIRALLLARERSAPPEPRRGRQLGEKRANELIAGAALILKRGDPTPVMFEGFLRARLRRGLILHGGWHWIDAETAAREVVRAALRQIGARRPSWQQGQPEANQFAVSFVKRTRCARCGMRIPDENRRFCSRRCAQAHWHLIDWRQREAERAIMEEGLCD